MSLAVPLLLVCACARAPKGPTTPLPPVALEKLPFTKAADSREFAEEREGVGRRVVFKGAADLTFDVTDVHLGPKKSLQAKAHGGSVYEVREGRASVTMDGKSREVGPGDIFTVGDGASVTISNAGDGPLALHVILVGTP